MKCLLRASVHVVLLVIAFNFFGLPSLSRYHDKKVVIISSRDGQQGLPAPSVTVCAANPKTARGFPTTETKTVNNGKSNGRIEGICQGNHGENIVHCVENRTFSLSSTVASLSVAGESVEGTWVPHFTYTPSGMCYTLDITVNLEQRIDESLSVGFKMNTTYAVFLNDPNLLLINYNPLTPITHISIEKPVLEVLPIVIIQHHDLDLASKPCSPSPSYSFSSCVTTSLSLQAGCRLPWDTSTDTALALCQRLDQYRCQPQLREQPTAVSMIKSRAHCK